MEIKEIQAEKQRLASAIHGAIMNFQSKTSAVVTDVRLQPIYGSDRADGLPINCNIRVTVEV